MRRPKQTIFKRLICVKEPEHGQSNIFSMISIGTGGLSRLARWAAFALLLGAPLAHGHALPAAHVSPASTPATASAPPCSKSAVLDAANGATASVHRAGACDRGGECCAAGCLQHCTPGEHALVRPDGDMSWPVLTSLWWFDTLFPSAQVVVSPEPHPPRA